MINDDKKNASVSSSAPLYVTDDGEEFTPQDLVTKKKQLRGRKYKIKSLADRISSPDFGKVSRK